ncbi:inositol hexakisphosphate-domain-containing protein [Kockovaella imperatae]|uniref:Inositol hexakisphosphate-domain-containing protein n=1 Tax=Kockovaella imperatae TaxID=4999 RepID=A0A1Y1UJ02_9TREE|nr:inositol hexakisphosphate-domain-containing protein [Kockovaella imperatae]ORX37949.1 inositol hexakisphosphate-domain-containing protein [Kockovaella imperatae]
MTHLPSRPSPLGAGSALSRTVSNPPTNMPQASGSGPSPRLGPTRPGVLSPRGSVVSLPGTIPPRASTHTGLYGLGGGQKVSREILGIQDRLRKETEGVVKRRTGSVLGRGYILKTDHYPTGRAMDLDLTIQGAPNFRAPLEEGLNVFGVAQPTTVGLQSILTILGCQPVHLLPPPTTISRRGSGVQADKPIVNPSLDGAALSKVKSTPSSTSILLDEKYDDAEGQAVWFSTREETLIYCNGRPYVLRDAASPFKTLAFSERAANIEDIERRLKLDILDEARRYGGMILTHDEVSGGALIPTWVSVEDRTIKTPKEVWNQYKEAGWRVEYWRIPIAPDTPIEDNYLDAYVNVLQKVDPLTTSLVFNCGMGVVRTTFAMIAALLVRRRQMILRGLDDPFPSATGGSGVSTPVAVPQAAQQLEQATHQQILNKALLRLTRVLERNLPSVHPSTAIDLLSAHPQLLEQLRRAHMGNYQIVLSLLSSLDHGRQMKQLVDQIIDSCDAVVNLRESVIEHRIKYSVSTMEDRNRQAILEKALRSLEQYFDLIVFSAYVEEEDAGDTGKSFSQWLMGRPEIWNQIKILRRRGGHRLMSFAPANDLSLISRSADVAEHSSLSGQKSRKGGLSVQGGKILGDEWAEHVVTNRTGIMLRSSTLLKSDLWLTESASSAEGVRGAVGFRQVRGAPIFATGQPTQEAIQTILKAVHERCDKVDRVVWVCLREEPLVMINGSPYCLRKTSFALRNMRDYSGVSASRLEMLEDRLKSDVCSELDEFQGRILLHTETADGEVVPVWESVDKLDVASVREVMDDVAAHTKDVQLEFVRVPITSESSPDFHDVTELLELCVRTDLSSTAFVLNDQLGRGRSSNAAIIVLLIERWLSRGSRTRKGDHRTIQYEILFPGEESDENSTPRRNRGTDASPLKSMSRTRDRTPIHSTPRSSWQIINSCLRIIRNGLRVKRIVDEAIDATSAQFNLRDEIEDLRMKALQCKTPDEKHHLVERGLNSLRRYYHLIVFQAYLDDTSPDEDHPYSFESFVRHRPVFKTLENELEEGGIEALTPIDRMEPAAGMALPDEVSKVVANRSGVILSAQTILKSDFFSGLQKQSLPERVDGAANYRKLPIIPQLDAFDEGGEANGLLDRHVYGTGMPNDTGLRKALEKMGAGPNGSRRVTWTSLREEPVLYVKGKPFVLRLVDRPLTNVETTGVTASVVERMETTLREDVLRELKKSQGRMLLHDEQEVKPGDYEVIPIWENVEPEEVTTPRELYEKVIQEGYKVDYARVAITDEQAPLPASLQFIVGRVARGLETGCDFVFNCQMGRGRTTTGMVTASLIATITMEDMTLESVTDLEEFASHGEDGLASESTQYLNGEYKTILQLVTVLSHGKQAKRITDKVINLMEGVQNLRRAVYECVTKCPSVKTVHHELNYPCSFKLKVDAAEIGSAKYSALMKQATNYLYRYGTLIVFANFLLEMKEKGTTLEETDFPAWLTYHREISSVLSRKGLD